MSGACVSQAELAVGTYAARVEVDENHFGGVHKGKRGRGAAGEVPVFGLLKCDGNGYATIIPDVASRMRVGIIRQRNRPGSVIYADRYCLDDVLDVSEFRHPRRGCPAGC